MIRCEEFSLLSLIYFCASKLIAASYNCNLKSLPLACDSCSSKFIFLVTQTFLADGQLSTVGIISLQRAKLQETGCIPCTLKPLLSHTKELHQFHVQDKTEERFQLVFTWFMNECFLYPHVTSFRHFIIQETVLRFSRAVVKGCSHIVFTLSICDSSVISKSGEHSS